MKNTKVHLWGKSAEPNHKDDFQPILETFFTNTKLPIAAVIICPGGGYGSTSDREAQPVAKAINSAGFHAFVLRYTVAPGRHPKPLQEVSQAVRLVRTNATQWHVDPNKIVVCGFSAGGHLAASLGVHWNRHFLQENNHLASESNRPDYLILSYPVITTGPYAHKGSFLNLLGENPSEELLQLMSVEKHVNENTPPTFLWHTYDDASVPVENSMLFASALRKNDIPFELHIYPKGPHGLSLATEETDNGHMGTHPHVGTWFDLAMGWLKTQIEF